MVKREGALGQQDAEKHPEKALVSQGAIIGRNASNPFAAGMRRSPVEETQASVGSLNAKNARRDFTRRAHNDMRSLGYSFTYQRFFRSSRFSRSLASTLSSSSPSMFM